jgi:RHS repeat-associated protein
MTSRVEGGASYTQAFNAEGRLSSITDGTDTWTFTYDGDGNRIKQANPDGTTTLFLGGGAYEVHIDGQTTTVTKYYAIAGQRVMRDSSGLHYLLADHLGSVVAVLDSSGDLESDERYLPFGGLRDTTGISQTDFAFTGQRNLADVGLMDYNARWYLPSVGRFISADPLVPSPRNPQSMNRYTYVANNPIKYLL